MKDAAILSYISEDILTLFGKTGFFNRPLERTTRRKLLFLDEEIERTVKAALEGLGLDWSIVSEDGTILKGASNKTLVIDPVDGSNNATRGIPFFATSVALADSDPYNITAAFVIDLPAKRTYRSERGKGAFLGEKRMRTRPYDREDPMVSSYLGRGSLPVNSSLIKMNRRNRYFGCVSLEICFVAEGILDLYVNMGRAPRFTDIAAAYLILKEAGGCLFCAQKGWTIKDYHLYIQRNKLKALFALGDPSAIPEALDLCGRKFVSKRDVPE